MDKRPGIESLLSPFHVLDLTDEKGYYFCAKILGDLGAEVIRLEKPGTKRDFWWWAYNHKKKLVYLDIEREQDKLLQLVREADLLVESFPPGYLDSLGLGYATLGKVNPSLIMTSLTPFGQTGPYKDLRASDLEIMAMSGALCVIGDLDRSPVRISFPQSHLMTSAEAAVGTLIALCQRELTGAGQQVDVSAQESVHVIVSSGINRWKYDAPKSRPRRIVRYHGTLPGIRLVGGQPKYHPGDPMLWDCKDGQACFVVHPGSRGAHNNGTLVKYMEAEGDLPDIVRNLRWENFDQLKIDPEDLGQVWDAFARFFARHTRQELYQISLKERLELFPGNTVKDLFTEEQLEYREFWQDGQIPDLDKTVKFPGPFAQILFPPAGSQTQTGLKEDGRRHVSPFDGVKVLDFSWRVTGPVITQWLSIYGAEIIKVESSSHLDLGRGNNSYGFLDRNSGKKSITLDLKHPRGREIACQLVRWADIVVENFTPGTLQRLGFGYDELVKINPRIVMLSASMLGANGPHASQPGLGHELTALVGFNDLTGWPDRPPVSAGGAYTDFIACRIAGATLFAAMNYQRRTGRGCYIDLSQFEASLHFLAPLILEYQATGNLLSRMGNRSLTDCPHGVFPCQGEERWCAISVSTDSEWRALCKALGKPEWVQDARFTTFEQRKQNEDELEKYLAEWTAQLPPEEVMACLQHAGVKAGMLEEWADLYNDPQLNHRKHFVTINHPHRKEYIFSDSGFRLGKTAAVVRPAPLLGEHNRYICTQILGLSDEEFDTYANSGVFE
ncbi:MAG: CoA transferase [Chloroflexi bacterium]|nr:CoA transferase [Chloroflexota bacterium]